MRYRLLWAIMSLVFALDATAQLASQKNSVNGVTVAVTPGKLASDAKVWDFAIVFDTHSQELSDDVAKSAVLKDEKGNEYKPIGWNGAAPGGHHRQGLLSFNAISPRPKVIELLIARPGEAKARQFRWDLQ